MEFQCYLNTERHMPAIFRLELEREKVFCQLLAESHGHQREVFPFGFPYERSALQKQTERPVFLLDRRIENENEHRFLHHREEDTVLLWSDATGWRCIELQVHEYDYDVFSMVSYSDSEHPEPSWVLHDGELIDVEKIAQRFFAITSVEAIGA